MKRRISLLALVSSLAVLIAVLLTGCAPANNAESEKGYLKLSVNPEIRIEYNADGLVTGLEGLNRDGSDIVSGYGDYIGKSCSDVLKDLVADIYQAGYFIEDADSGRRQVVLQIEPGSALPDDDFLELLRGDVQAEMKDLALEAPVVDIDSSDYDQRYASDTQPSPYITLEKAKEIALAHAEVKAADAHWDDREFDFENGQPIFELEFSAGGVEYSYDIDAQNGKILRSVSERDDDRANSSSSNSSSSNASSNASSGGYIGLEKARQIALKKAGVSANDVRWEDREFDLDDGTPVYELEFRAGSMEYSCDVHAVTGAVLDYDVEHDDDDNKRSEPSKSESPKSEPSKSESSSSADYIGMDSAKAIALKKAGVSAGDVRWESAELDRDDGSPVYELEFSAAGMEHSCEIHAESGKILDYDAERDD